VVRVTRTAKSFGWGIGHSIVRYHDEVAISRCPPHSISAPSDAAVACSTGENGETFETKAQKGLIVFRDIIKPMQDVFGGGSDRATVR